MNGYFIAALIIWVLAISAAYLIGERKDRLGEAVALGILLSWLGVLIIAVMQPSRAEKVRREQERLGITEEARASQPPHPAGWYADPYGHHAQRWWDGRKWTAKTRELAV
ncbi:MAG: DUF2510 domain-containing protein [Actinobacteria bacterium]|nr:DUF2510 domain-containing protein [Actinomycetota bacterium]